MLDVKSVSRKFLALAVLLGAWSSSYAVTYSWEHVSGSRSSPPYGWNYSYDIGYFNNSITVDVDIKLVGTDPGTSLRNIWTSGIESMWSTTRFSVPILFNVDWVTSGQDQTVNVVAGDGRDNMTTWYTGDPGGWGYAFQDEAAAHEFGHMLSLYDEYVDGAVDPVTRLTGTGGLMETLYGSTLDSYYAPFLDWFAGKQAQASAVPEPETYALMLAGLGLMGAIGRRRIRPSKSPSA